jgi:Raf kinase inhibitor-like YbhB/YbcL family protein
MKNILILFLFLFILGCSNKTMEVINMEIKSPTFQNKENIPVEYTCDGDNISPELEISDIPENTVSLTLIMDDPDAPVGTFTHWLVWNIPPSKTKIEKGESLSPSGTTGFGRIGYGGPCPPSGTHRYYFKLYSLYTNLNLDEGATRQQLEEAMQGHVIEKAELIGTYNRDKLSL